MKMEKLFYLDQHGTTVSTEIRAGLTTFVAMAYIIFLNPVYLSATGMDSAGVLAATCLSAALGTALSKIPFGGFRQNFAVCCVHNLQPEKCFSPRTRRGRKRF